MAIVLTLPADFGIENYEGLQSFLTEHLQLDQDTASQLPNLIRLAEYRLNRLILAPDRESETTLATVAGEQSVALPSDYRQGKQLNLTDANGYPLDEVALGVVESYDCAGRPLVYSVFGSDILLGPVPDGVYTLKLRYMASLSPLTSDSPTNWLLASNADVYVWMAAAVVTFHLGDERLASTYVSLAEGAADEINAQGNRYRGAPRLRSPVAVV